MPAPLAGTREDAPLETGRILITSQPVPAGLPSPPFFPLAHRGASPEEQVERAQK